MRDQGDEDRIEGTLVDVDMQKGTITIEVEGDFFVCLWSSDFEAEIGDKIEISCDDILNA